MGSSRPDAHHVLNMHITATAKRLKNPLTLQMLAVFGSKNLGPADGWVSCRKPYRTYKVLCVYRMCCARK